MNTKLILNDGTEYEGVSFGATKSVSGEVVFTTGMVGYPETLTDPSFCGQILVFTYPIIGNYGVPDKKFWESGKIQVTGIIVCNYNSTPSHFSSRQTLARWLKKENVPGLEIKDTRGLTLKLRKQGVMLGKIIVNRETTQKFSNKNREDIIDFKDPNLCNLVAEVSTKKVLRYGKGKKTVVVIDCGAKQNIVRELVNRHIKVVVVPWNYDIFKYKVKFDGLLISNGPGDPKMATTTIAVVKKALGGKKPILGICLGNQILALAAGGETYKLKFGHRGQNQPCQLVGSQRCYLTTQNHGFAVGKIPPGFKVWFKNANDGTNEGIIHARKPFMSVQFHPESNPGPTDANWVFDYFLKKI